MPEPENKNPQPTINEKSQTPADPPDAQIVPEMATPSGGGKKFPVKSSILLIIVLIILIAGAVIFAAKNNPATAPSPGTTPAVTTPSPAADQVEQNLKDVGSSDEITAIDKDIQKTNIENIDSDLSRIQAEVQ